MPNWFKALLAIILGIIVGILIAGLTWPLWAMALLLVVAVSVILLIIDGLDALMEWALVRTVRCRLKPMWVVKDYCTGTCPPGEDCVATSTRPYGPFGWFTQAAACTCVPTATGGAGTGGSGSSGSGSSAGE